MKELRMPVKKEKGFRFNDLPVGATVVVCDIWFERDADGKVYLWDTASYHTGIDAILLGFGKGFVRVQKLEGDKVLLLSSPKKLVDFKKRCHGNLEVFV